MSNDKTNEADARIRKIWDSLNEKERSAVAFGLVPKKLQGLARDDLVSLMKIREQEGPRMVFDNPQIIGGYGTT